MSWNKITKDNIHVGQRRIKSDVLRRVLEESGRKYECEECSNSGIWNEQPLRLQVDHKNGNEYDNSLTNIRYLCPNCHTQTVTHSFKGRKHSDEARQKMSEKSSKPRPNQYAKVM